MGDGDKGDVFVSSGEEPDPDVGRGEDESKRGVNEKTRVTVDSPVPGLWVKKGEGP